MTPTAPLPEAAFSLCLKGTLGGVDAQLTVRGQTYQDFAANVASVQGLLDPRADVPPSLPASQPTLAGWCAIHGMQMQMQSNERGSWYSHKTPDGWCRGTARKRA